jgi:hypothetical protein
VNPTRKPGLQSSAAVITRSPIRPSLLVRHTPKTTSRFDTNGGAGNGIAGRCTGKPRTTGRRRAPARSSADNRGTSGGNGTALTTADILSSDCANASAGLTSLVEAMLRQLQSRGSHQPGKRQIHSKRAGRKPELRVAKMPQHGVQAHSLTTGPNV